MTEENPSSSAAGPNGTSETVLDIICLVGIEGANLSALVASLPGVNLITDIRTQGAKASALRRPCAAIVMDFSAQASLTVDWLKDFRTMHANEQTPILGLVDATFDQRLRTSVLQLDYVDVLEKPLDPLLLKSKLSNYVLSAREQAALNQKISVLSKGTDSRAAYILENALDAVVATDDQNKVIFWNNHAEKIFGFTKADIMNQDMTEFIIPARFREMHRAGVRRFVETGIANPKIQNRRLEIVGLRKSGEEFVMELTVSSVRTDDRYYFYSFMRDVSAVQEAKRQLDESEATLKQIFLESPSFMAFIRGPDYVFERANEEYFKLTGRRDIIGRKLIDVFPEIEGQGFITILDRVYTTKERFVGTEVPLVLTNTATGAKQLYVDVVYQPLTHPNGDVYGVAAQGYDVTEKVLSRKRIEESERLFKTVTDNAASCLFVMDKSGHPTFMNPAAQRVTGYSSVDEINARPLHYAVHYKKPDGSPYPMEECPIDNAQAQLTALQDQEEIFVDKSGRLYPVSYSVAPLEQDGEVIGSVLEFRDVTVQKQVEAELIRAKDEAERANELKSAFLANMSHEIRTPLGAMMGFADLLKDPGLTSSERQSFTDILSRNGESLSVIINDILDFSKIEAGHLTLEYTDTFPDQVGADVISLLRVKAREKDLVLNYTHDPESPVSVVADPVRVRQILLNLVSNAIKFTQFGSVSLHSFGCKTDKGRDALCFEINDTGIGIPKAQHEKVFEMFVQADGSMTRRFGGTGLGLALSRSLARAMGGDVQLTESEVGVGSTFLVTIEDRPEMREKSDYEQPAAQPQVELMENALANLKILVVDDAPDNQQLIWRYLTKQGAVVESAENGLLGYRMALAGDYDLVLMDIQMPVMDGYSATQKLREAGYSKPILALTAHAMNEVRRKALNVGYTDHLTKPIKSKELIRMIARLTGRLESLGP